MELEPGLNMPAILTELITSVNNIDSKFDELESKLSDLAKMNGRGDAIRDKIRKRLRKQHLKAKTHKKDV